MIDFNLWISILYVQLSTFKRGAIRNFKGWLKLHSLKYWVELDASIKFLNAMSKVMYFIPTRGESKIRVRQWSVFLALFIYLLFFLWVVVILKFWTSIPHLKFQWYLKLFYSLVQLINTTYHLKDRLRSIKLIYFFLFVDHWMDANLPSILLFAIWKAIFWILVWNEDPYSEKFY